jgi:hypothetical protein
VSNQSQSSENRAQRLAEGVYEDALLDRCEYLRSIGFWGGRVQVQPRQWLSNFPDEDAKRHALHLIGALQYYNAALCSALARSGLREVIRLGAQSRADQDAADYVDEWRRAAARTCVAVLSAAEETFVDAIRQAAAQSELPFGIMGPTGELPFAGTASVVLVVDNIDATSQELGEIAQDSDRDEAVSVLALFEPDRPGITGSPRTVAVHRIPDVYSVTHPASVVWPSELQQSGPDFIRATRAALGIPGAVEPESQTAITFGHRVPAMAESLLSYRASDFLPLLTVEG